MRQCVAACCSMLPYTAEFKGHWDCNTLQHTATCQYLASGICPSVCVSTHTTADGVCFASRVCVCMCESVFVCVQICMCVCACLCVCVCAYVSICADFHAKTAYWCVSFAVCCSVCSVWFYAPTCWWPTFSRICQCILKPLLVYPCTVLRISDVHVCDIDVSDIDRSHRFV